MSVEDRKALAVFVGDLQVLLERVAYEPQDLIYEPHREALRDAWFEISRAETFARLVLELENGELENEDLDHELDRRGLTGAQLRVKLKGFYHWVERENEQYLEVEEIPPRRRRRRRKWFRRALRWADIPLGSLGLIPGLGLFVDPVAEIKDCFLEASEDRDA